MPVPGEETAKIAFVGKGGSGKTTLSSLLVRHLVAAGAPVLAIDADINQHLGVALGLSEDAAASIPAMGEHLAEIKSYLRVTTPGSPRRRRWSRPPRRGRAHDCCGLAVTIRCTRGSRSTPGAYG